MSSTCPRMASTRPDCSGSPVRLGDADRLVPRSCWEELERGLPDLRLVEFADCGHYPQYTHPGAMAEAISAFLGEHSRVATL